jgi:hypothetical protein
MHLICLKANTAPKFMALQILAGYFVHETEKGKFGRRFAFPLLYLFLKERI